MQIKGNSDTNKRKFYWTGLSRVCPKVMESFYNKTVIECNLFISSKIVLISMYSSAVGIYSANFTSRESKACFYCIYLSSMWYIDDHLVALCVVGLNGVNLRSLDDILMFLCLVINLLIFSIICLCSSRILSVAKLNLWLAHPMKFTDNKVANFLSVGQLSHTKNFISLLDFP